MDQRNKLKTGEKRWGTQVPKVAVIGTGRRALDGYIKVLLEQFSERIKIVAVSDRVSRKLDEARQILGPEVKLFSDYQELLSSTDVDAMIVCTPDFTHEQINLDCLKGCHAFDIMNWLADSSPQTVAAFGNLAVFNPGTKPAYAQHCTNCPEKYTCIDSVYLKLDKEVIKRQQERGYTDFDLCLYNSEKDTQDNDVVIIEYKNGVKASYTECLFSACTGRFYSVVGEKGEIKADTESNRIGVHSLVSKETTVHQIPDISGHGGGDSLLLEDFFICFHQRGKPLADGEAGSWATAVGEAAEKAIAESKVVKIGDL